MTASETLAREAELRAASREGMAALVHALLSDPWLEETLAQERGLKMAISAYVLAKRQLSYNMKHGLHEDAWQQQRDAVADARRKVRELGGLFEPELFALIKKRIGPYLCFGPNPFPQRWLEAEKECRASNRR